MVELKSFIEFLRRCAEKKALEADVPWSLIDPEKPALLEQIECFVAGTKFVESDRPGMHPDHIEVPKCWENYMKEYLRENDPEYAEYLRLMKKFGAMK